MVGISGTVEARWYANVLIPRVANAAVMGLNVAGEALKSAAQELSPVDTGRLRSSASLHPATPGNLAVRVTFNAGLYAIVVHEGVRLGRPIRIKRGKNPRAQTKYLSTPLKRDKERLLAIVGTYVRQAM